MYKYPILRKIRPSWFWWWLKCDITDNNIHLVNINLILVKLTETKTGKRLSSIGSLCFADQINFEKYKVRKPVEYQLNKKILSNLLMILNQLLI